MDLLAGFHSEWRFVRGLTLDLLGQLDDEALSFSPVAGMGPFWKQFRHVGRVQEDYVRALESGQVVFSSEQSTWRHGAGSKELAAYLEDCDRSMSRALEGVDLNTTIDWQGSPVGLPEHLYRLVSHETFHHGQWVIYMRARAAAMPASWAAWGV